MHQSSTIKWSSLIIGVSFLIIGVFIISFPEENLFAITWLICKTSNQKNSTSKFYNACYIRYY